MVLGMIWRLVAGAALMLAMPGVALAQAKFSNGTYMVEGGSYSITVEQQGDSLIVVEPNKRSEYTRVPNGTYQFRNPTNGILYGLRVIDDHTIDAFKPDREDVAPTRLARLGGPPAPAETEPAPVAATASGPVLAPVAATDSYSKLAQHYLELTTSDPDNVQSWTACAAAALKHSMANSAEAEAYAAETAKRLKTILADPGRSPCKDVLPDTLFAGAGPDGSLSAAQQAQLDAANARANERIEAGKIEAARRAEQQRAYEQGVAAAKAAEAQYAQDRAAYQAGVAKADAAKADYERRMEEYRQQTGGKGAPD